MRKLWAACAAMSVCLVLGGLSVLAQSPSPGPSPGAVAEGRTYIVTQDGAGDFGTIAEAVGAALDGDTVLVRHGTYEESITVSEDITLTGEGGRSAVVITAPAGAAATLRLVGSDAVIRELTLSGPASEAVVMVLGGRPTLEDVRVDSRATLGWGSSAFQLVGPSAPLIRDSTWGGYLAVRDGPAPTIVGNVISGDIISMDGPGAATIRGNTFREGAGISVSWGAVGIIEDNTFGGGAAIGVDTGSAMIVRGNTIRDVPDAAAIGVSDSGTSAVIDGNTVTGSAVGIQVGRGAHALVTGNVFCDDGVDLSVGGDAAVLSQGNETCEVSEVAGW